MCISRPGPSTIRAGRITTSRPTRLPRSSSRWTCARSLGGRGGFGGGANAQELQAAEQTGTSPAPMPPPAPARTEPVTQEELDQYLASIKDKVKGAIIFYGPHVEVPLDFVTAPFRRPEESYEQQGGRRGGRGGAPAGRGRGAAPSGLTAAEITAQTNR